MRRYTKFPPRRRTDAQLQAEADREAAYQRQFAGPVLDLPDYDDPSNPDADLDPKWDDRDEEGRPR